MARRSAPSSCSSHLPPWRSPLACSRWVKSFVCLSVEHGDPALVAVAVASVGGADGRGPAGSDPDRRPDELHQLVDAGVSAGRTVLALVFGAFTESAVDAQDSGDRKSVV